MMASKKETPLYRVSTDAKLPVSSREGPLWKERLKQCQAAYKGVWEGWDKSFAYYNFNHTKELLTDKFGTFRAGDGSENIVFGNISTVLPSIYTKNPDIVIHHDDAEDDAVVKVIEKVINARIRKPAINLKAKMRRAAMFTELTNFGVLKLNYTAPGDDREAATEKLVEITEQLKKAKSEKEIEELKGQISVLDETFEISEPAGVSLINIHSHNLIVDPNCEYADLSDADWVIERTLINTAYLKARFTTPSKDGKTDMLVFNPKHEAKFGVSEHQMQEGVDTGLTYLADSIDSEAENYKNFESNERRAYQHKTMTQCYYVWDKVRRRVLLFTDDFAWPLWVWDDPLKLSQFFPYFILQFYLSTGNIVTGGEVQYYLDQQDEINDINRKITRLRRTVFDYFLYDKNASDGSDIANLLNAIREETKLPGKQKSVGVKLQENQKIDDIIFPIIPPAAELQQLFDKGPALAAVDRVSAMSDALRGEQFKTNTTEDAVQVVALPRS